MSLTPFIIAASESGSSEPAIHPLLVGGIALGILLFALVCLLMFGAGREHS